ncbi:chaplin [Streptomyces bluensis]|uniref:chaplin n=1 Tax=Streptomyces bluensis TaxID=33897 RepID=UPI0010651218|nr:chaplin [Streptomyces bluensis]GGZ73313.1 membrane protein [Streptomyces bluensis]
MSRIAKVGAVALGTGAVVLSGSGLAGADAGAKAVAVGSQGIASGNVVQLPIHVPINLCGNTVTGLGGLNPALGNACKNGADKKDAKKSVKSGKKAHHRYGL